MSTNDCCGPGQPLNGVTEMVAVMGVLPGLAVVKLLMLPVPPAARPMEVLVLVQVYVVPLMEEVKANAPVADPAQKTVSCGTTTLGAGFTVTCLFTVTDPHSLVTVREMV